MDSKESINDLLQTLEVSLTNLLQRVKGDPWSLLIFQTLLWSFRRWAIHYLMSTEMTGSMHEYIWENQIDLIRTFAPDGLKDFGVVWLNPMNVGDRIDILEELNAYFLCIVDNLDKAIQTENDDDQNAMAIFLDETITEVIGKWINGREEYRIYPGSSESADSFPMDKIFTIMQLILEKHVKRDGNQEDTSTVSHPAVEEESQDQPVEEQSQAPEALEPPELPQPVEEQPQPQPEPQPPQPQPPEPHPPQPPQPSPTIASALRRRRTMRVHGRRGRLFAPVSSTRKHKLQ